MGVKKMELSYGIPLVLKEYIPKLHHGSDGLIFTCVETGYVSGTDPTLCAPAVFCASFGR